MAGADCVEDNLLQLFRRLARARKAGEVRELSGVSIASCGCAFQTFNAAFLSERVTARAGDLERRITTAAVHFGARGLRWAYWVCEHKLEQGPRRRAQAVFHSHGLGLSFQHPGMLAERLLPPARPLPALEIRRVEEEQSRLAFCHVNSVAFRVPFEWCRELYDLESLWGGDFAGYLGCVNGQPVTTAATMFAAGAVGVYCVATLPDQFGKGYAEATVRHALEKARLATGVERAVLQSTAVGLPLYRRMGFETVTKFSVYSSVV